MPDQPADQIAKLQQSIASLEETQRATGIDLSAQIQSLRVILSTREQAAPSIITQSGGVEVTSEHVAIGGDVVGGDKTITAGGHVIINENGTIIIESPGELPVPMTAVKRESALGRYLQHVISRNRYLQLQGIRSGGKLVSIELDQIFVTLRATRERTVST